MTLANFRRFFTRLKGVYQDPSTGDLMVGGQPLTITNVVATWADLQAIPKVSGNDKLHVHVRSVGTSGATFFYNHANTKWYLVGASAFLLKSSTAVTHTSAYATEESAFNFQLENNAAGAALSLLQNGDRLILKSTITKTGGADVIRHRLRVGTASGITGTDLTGAATPGATNVFIQARIELERIDATHIRFMGVYNSTSGYAVASTTAFQAAFAVANLDTTPTLFLNYGFHVTAKTTDTALVCEDYSLELITCGN